MVPPLQAPCRHPCQLLAPDSLVSCSGPLQVAVSALRVTHTSILRVGIFLSVVARAFMPAPLPR